MGINRLVEQGNWLFRWRSFLPIVVLAPIAVALADFHYLQYSRAAQDWWAVGCLAVSLLGLLVRALCIGFAPRGTSGCNTHRQKAAALNTTGMYSVTRNPLYFGNLLIWMGIIAVLRNPLLLLCFCLAFWLYYERIIAAEEAFLTRQFGDAYTDWASRTPAFLPRLTGWKRPDLRFSLKSVCRRDYGAVLGIVTAFFLLDVAEHVAVEGRLLFDPPWAILLAFGLAAFLILRFLKKHTRILRVTDR